MIGILLVIGFSFCFFIVFMFSLIKAGSKADKLEEDLASIILGDSLDNASLVSKDVKAKFAKNSKKIPAVTESR